MVTDTVRDQLPADVDERAGTAITVRVIAHTDEPLIREAAPEDDAVIGRIAAEGDAGADAAYLALLRHLGTRLHVAVAGEQVVGFSGVLDLPDAAMLTDLFVSAEARGRGYGSRLLSVAFADRPRRMTFSSGHPAAHAAYERFEMTARWRLVYLQGTATGGGMLPAEGPWRHDRQRLVDHWASQGAHVSPDVVVLVADDGVRIARLQHEEPVPLVEAVLGGLAAGTPVTMCVPETSELATWAADQGFVVTEFDTYRTTPGVELSPALHVLDPGLA